MPVLKLALCLISPTTLRIMPLWWLESADNMHWAKLPENPSNIVLLGQIDTLING